ncbi:MAG: GreA/GreB family elongation factor [Myxococcaceae bacterium]
MSKAFTSEETPDEQVLGRNVTRVARGQERPMTLEGHRELVREQEALQAERPATKDEAARARLDHRLAIIAATLESVKVVAVPPPDGTVRFGSTVALRWDDGREQTVRLVGPDEVKDGCVSVESPLARALLEQRAGDEVELQRPRGAATATILRVQ